MVSLQMSQRCEISDLFGTKSGITFISRVYAGRITDQKLTLESGFLDHLPQFSTTMTYNGFKLLHEWTGRKIYFEVPLSKRGTTQMNPVQFSKTKTNGTTTSNWTFKTFRIFVDKIPLLNQINVMLIVFAAICNFKELLYFYWFFKGAFSLWKVKQSKCFVKLCLNILIFQWNI